MIVPLDIYRWLKEAGLDEGTAYNYCVKVARQSRALRSMHPREDAAVADAYERAACLFDEDIRAKAQHKSNQH